MRSGSASPRTRGQEAVLLRTLDVRQIRRGDSGEEEGIKDVEDQRYSSSRRPQGPGLLGKSWRVPASISLAGKGAGACGPVVASKASGPHLRFRVFGSAHGDPCLRANRWNRGM